MGYIRADTLPTEMLTTSGTYASQSDGGDIRFTQDALGKIPLPADMIGSYTQGASPPTSCVANFWVYLPAIYSTSNTLNTIYVWYHASITETWPLATDATWGSKLVWSQANGVGYSAVWHCNSGNAGQGDSVSGNTMAKTGTLSNTAQNTSTGPFTGPAVTGFVASTDYLTSISKVGETGAFSITAWIC